MFFLLYYLKDSRYRNDNPDHIDESGWEGSIINGIGDQEGGSSKIQYLK